MGCNCKTTEKILKIHKKYGYEVQTSWKERVNYKITNILMKILKIILFFIFLPIIFIVILFLVFKGKTNINITNFLNTLLKKKKK